MNIEVLGKIIETLLDKPGYGIVVVFLAIFITILGWYASSYFKEAAKQRVLRRATKQDGKVDPSPVTKSDTSEPPKGNHFPIVTFSDGTSAEVQVSLTYKVVDSYKYTYESSDPLGILSNLVDGRLRQAFESITVEHARERRKELASSVADELSDEFLRYGIELRAIVVGSIRALSN